MGAYMKGIKQQRQQTNHSVKELRELSIEELTELKVKFWNEAKQAKFHSSHTLELGFVRLYNKVSKILVEKINK